MLWWISAWRRLARAYPHAALAARMATRIISTVIGSLHLAAQAAHTAGEPGAKAIIKRSAVAVMTHRTAACGIHSSLMARLKQHTHAGMDTAFADVSIISPDIGARHHAAGITRSAAYRKAT